MKRTAFILAAGIAMLTGCIETHVVIDQPKPMEINFNVSGQLNLVIQDARQDMEKITGEKPTNVVRPEDLGLPAASQGAVAVPERRDFAGQPAEDWVPVGLKTRGLPDGTGPTEGHFVEVALKDDLQTKMAARDKEIRALWDSQAVGEAHTGLLVVKGTVTAAQQTLVNAENADRAALFEDEAKAKKTKVEDVALGFYVARLGYAKKGAWYEKKNARGDWEWVHWER